MSPVEPGHPGGRGHLHLTRSLTGEEKTQARQRRLSIAPGDPVILKSLWYLSPHSHRMGCGAAVWTRAVPALLGGGCRKWGSPRLVPGSPRLGFRGGVDVHALCVRNAGPAPGCCLSCFFVRGSLRGLESGGPAAPAALLGPRRLSSSRLCCRRPLAPGRPHRGQGLSAALRGNQGDGRAFLECEASVSKPGDLLPAFLSCPSWHNGPQIRRRLEAEWGRREPTRGPGFSIRI